MKDANGKYIDDPGAREKFWETAPRAQDKNGNPVILLSGWWFSYDPDRLWEIVKNLQEGERVIFARASDGRIYSKERRELINNKKNLQRRISTKWYVYLDPQIQQVFG